MASQLQDDHKIVLGGSLLNGTLHILEIIQFELDWVLKALSQFYLTTSLTLSK